MNKYLCLVFVTLISIGSTQAQKKETRDVDDFTGIAFGVAGKLYLTQGNSYKVVLEGDEDYLEDIETFVRGDRLIIRHSRWMSFGNKKINAYITMPEIEDLAVSGSGKMTADSDIEADDLDMSVSGSGDINIDKLTAESVDCRISGSGSINLNGSAENGDISISGSGDFTGESFDMETLDISISGSGTCRVKVNESLEARVSGSGDIYYDGNPRVDARVSGSGKVRKR